ncbi:MAG: hypothetical protein AB7Q76_17660 [Gammaproteobacteria bacterium]
MRKSRLIVDHSASGGTRALLDAVVAGATDPAITALEVRVQTAFETTAEDVRGTLGAIERITTGLRWRLPFPAVIARGDPAPAQLAECTELGQTFAAALEAGTI